VWKIGDLNLAVIMVGKTLVHHKLYRTRSTGDSSHAYLETGAAEVPVAQQGRP
jgi:hypothetical protein